MNMNHGMLLLGSIMGAFCGISPLMAEIELTDIKGNKLNCEIKEALPGSYTLVAGGRTMKISDADLSAESRAAAVAYAKDKGVFKSFPAVTVEVMVGTKRNTGGAWYIKIMDIEPRISLAGSSKLIELPKAKATMVIVTMDTREKYTNKNEVLKVHTAQTIDVPAGPGEKRYFDFKASKVSYDSYRDTSNVGGEIYKYFIFGLIDAASGDIVDFQTNYPELKKLTLTDPSTRTKYLGMNEGAQLPEKLD